MTKMSVITWPNCYDEIRKVLHAEGVDGISHRYLQSWMPERQSGSLMRHGLNYGGYNWIRMDCTVPENRVEQVRIALETLADQHFMGPVEFEFQRHGKRPHGTIRDWFRTVFS